MEVRTFIMAMVACFLLVHVETQLSKQDQKETKWLTSYSKIADGFQKVSEYKSLVKDIKNALPYAQTVSGQNPPRQNPPGQNPPSIFYILLTVIYFINSSN